MSYEKLTVAVLRFRPISREPDWLGGDPRKNLAVLTRELAVQYGLGKHLLRVGVDNLVHDLQVSHVPKI